MSWSGLEHGKLIFALQTILCLGTRRAPGKEGCVSTRRRFRRRRQEEGSWFPISSVLFLLPFWPGNKSETSSYLLHLIRWLAHFGHLFNHFTENHILPLQWRSPGCKSNAILSFSPRLENETRKRFFKSTRKFKSTCKLSKIVIWPFAPAFSFNVWPFRPSGPDPQCFDPD